MSEASNSNARNIGPALQINGLNVYYGASHALQGVDLTLDTGVLSVVGRNGMGKTTLCMAIMGLVPVSSGSIRFHGQELAGLSPPDIARLGVGYVPQGRRLWRSLTVDEHLRMVGVGHAGAWTRDRIYSTFPRLAERKNNGGAQLSGGEQQMLAISRALLTNPKLLVMDEPTEGLAPRIVGQVEEMLLTLGAEGGMNVLVIEQNIGVATAVSRDTAIMVNGRINRTIDSAQLSADRDLQQSLLGVGRHAHDEVDVIDEAQSGDVKKGTIPASADGPRKVWNSNPKLPHRWSQATPVHVIENSARVISGSLAAGIVDRGPEGSTELRSLGPQGLPIVLVAGTLDTKGEELRYVRDIVAAQGLTTRLVDLSTSGGHSGADVPAYQVAAFHPRGAAGVFIGDRGQSVAGMTVAFERWMKRQTGVAGIIVAGGSGGTAIAAPAMRALPFGVPKLIVSTVASGEVRQYVGASDITMMHAVADVQGINAISREVLANGAHALAGMVAAWRDRQVQDIEDKPSLGLTMFGVTTPAVQQLVAQLDQDYDCLVFHATGIGGQSMESLIDSGLITSVLDVTTTEICDMLMGGVFPANEDRFGAMIRKRMPYVGACGALDMVNLGAPPTVPEQYRGRLFYEHNPQVTLMRTTPEENAEMGRWIGERLNLMEAPVRFFLPEGGVSLLDALGQAFWDPAADKALFDALESTVRQTSQRKLIRIPHNINDPEVVAAMLAAFRELNGGATERPRPSRAARR